MIIYLKSPQGEEQFIDFGIYYKGENMTGTKVKEVMTVQSLIESLRPHIKNCVLEGKTVDEITTILKEQYKLSDKGVEVVFDKLLSEKQVVIDNNMFVYVDAPKIKI